MSYALGQLSSIGYSFCDHLCVLDHLDHAVTDCFLNQIRNDLITNPSLRRGLNDRLDERAMTMTANLFD